MGAACSRAEPARTERAVSSNTTLQECKTRALELTRSAAQGRAGDRKDSNIINKEIHNLGSTMAPLYNLVLCRLGFSLLKELRPLLEPLLRCCNSRHLLARCNYNYRFTLQLDYLLPLARKAK